MAEIAGHTHLHPFVTDDIKGANHAEHKLDDFAEALVSNTPRAVDEEDQVSFGTFADCEGREAGTCWAECLCDANTINACLDKWLFENLPSRASGMVGGGGGVGGTVGASVGLTTEE